MGFWEFIVIVIVGVIVLGPDKLPHAIRRVTQFKRQLNQTMQSMSANMNEQLRAHELHEHLKQAEELNFKDLPPHIQASVDELRQAAESVNSTLEKKENKQDGE